MSTKKEKNTSNINKDIYYQWILNIQLNNQLNIINIPISWEKKVRAIYLKARFSKSWLKHRKFLWNDIIYHKSIISGTDWFLMGPHKNWSNLLLCGYGIYYENILWPEIILNSKSWLPGTSFSHMRIFTCNRQGWIELKMTVPHN